ncbi:MAG: Isoleucine-tRNA ligase [Candidatus Moranbacteria bacterium GW2011_GWF2_36_839]|nr:MAG: Isoleucine-tRNA ligase [Candidatus Moranbacteria bacterium GW2011_GWF1_36_78]KKQ17555.1 MAG: Isoleucine-tRNA ligase [Candidatus Moranbacteria bacterium GW2011_GWF2_36_839]HAT74279.1 isoleucine--tRNA ligase [Candidatus Moranbacteria bacterium]HBY10942.1 isoleucine--tRNA ligase [Candidatus Moranbacteria bacterium]
MFKKVEVKQSFPKMEEEILKFWEENEIFQKSVEKNPEDKSFVFYEGPPTANGVPGLHHVLARAFKDIIPRYKTMKGYRVERKAGWDTHGLPVELQVEKALGLKNKQEIENIIPGNPRESVIEFNKKCKESVWLYRDLWEKLTQRMAYWVDMKKPYVTYENKYIESVWWVIAQIFKTKNKNGESLIYQGHKVVPYCYRCGTALSSHEVAQGYQVVKDNSVFVKFKLKPEQEFGGGKYKTKDSAYILVWTTTPWTLPGNVALAVNKNVKYTSLRIKDISELIIVASDLIEKIFKDKEMEIVHDDMSGNDLIGLEYEPLYKTNDSDKKAYRVVSGDFVTTQDGTGIVHIAPAFGEDDSNVGRENDLPTLITVDTEGKMSAEVPGFGIPVKKKNEKNKYAVDELILEDLKKRELLFKEELYEHDYPFCWRCDTPLIYYAKPSWFIRMSEFSEKLVKNNEKINWIPEHFREGRFGEWLKGVKDWAISRERYWGTPLPIWKCEKCGELKVIESQKELEDLSGQKIEDLHKPYIDEVKFECVCGEEMKKVPEVLDVWFDSGSMPLAQFYYPASASMEEKEKVESGKFFPADYISEAVDQTRGWFYTLHAIATLLNESGKVPTGYAFKNVICLGHILDAKGKKMSKSKGNVIEPMKVMDEYGADMLRWMLYTINQPGLPKKFDIKNMKDIMNRVFRMLWNSYSFFVMYANIDGFQPQDTRYKIQDTKNLLDKWIISEMQMLIKNVDEKLEAYDVYSSAKSIEVFVDNLSNWYIRRSRKRFWKSENDGDKNEAYETLHYVLITLSKLMAPFTPFISEEIYRNLSSAVETQNFASVHLQDFPIADEKLIDERLNKEMEETRNIITEALQLRAKAGIKVRQPLSELLITNCELRAEFLDIIKEELNIKEVKFVGEFKMDDAQSSSSVENIKLNTEITLELKLEGQAREVIRFIQEMRKEAGYEVDNRIEIVYSGESLIFNNIDLKKLIAKETLANGILSSNEISGDLKKTFEVDGEKLEIGVRKI